MHELCDFVTFFFAIVIHLTFDGLARPYIALKTIYLSKYFDSVSDVSEPLDLILTPSVPDVPPLTSTRLKYIDFICFA